MRRRGVSGDGVGWCFVPYLVLYFVSGRDGEEIGAGDGVEETGLGEAVAVVDDAGVDEGGEAGETVEGELAGWIFELEM